MNWKPKELVKLLVLPIIASVSAGILINLFTGVSIHNPVSLSWVKAALFAHLPAWITLIVVAVAAILAGLNIRGSEHFDVFADFSIDMNPTGPWLYGSSRALGGPIALFTTKQPGYLHGRADRWSSPELSRDIGVTRNKIGSTFSDDLTHDIPHDAIHMHPGEGGIFAA